MSRKLFFFQQRTILFPAQPPAVVLKCRLAVLLAPLILPSTCGTLQFRPTKSFNCDCSRSGTLLPLSTLAPRPAPSASEPWLSTLAASSGCSSTSSKSSPARTTTQFSSGTFSTAPRDRTLRPPRTGHPRHHRALRAEEEERLPLQSLLRRPERPLQRKEGCNENRHILLAIPAVAGINFVIVKKVCPNAFYWVGRSWNMRFA